MIKSLFIAQVLLLLPLAVQDSAATRHVVRTWPEGNPYVVVYTSGPDQVKVMEELYYENGQLDYIGHYQNGKEHGEWKYFWENGNVKSVEYYEKGLEQGTMFDYNEEGQPIVKYRYVKGELVSEQQLTP